MYDLQRASMWKRISAAILDMILLLIVITGCAFLLTSVLRYDSYVDRMQVCRDQYEERYGVTFDISTEDYDALTDVDRELYDSAIKAFSADDEVGYLYSMIFNLTLIIVTFSVLLACVLLEFAVPLILKNGQTLGKKIFGIGVMRIDGVRISPLILFVRTILGKYTIGIMIPLLLLIAVYFNFLGIVGILCAAALVLAQLLLALITRYHTPIHDKLACTVAVDMASQMIFDTPEERVAYLKKLHEQETKSEDRG